jgi:prepilin-type N-terminal cleavage/methylation domain-containing protein
MRLNRLQCRSGFTLPEMMVTIGVMTIVGMMVFLVLNSGMVLYAKNTAVNSAHQQARAGVDEMLANIHSSVSIPQLVDTNLQPVPEIGADGSPTPAPGISYQAFAAGPFPVVADSAASDTYVQLNCPGGYVPPANVRVEIPSHNIELDATSTSSVGSVWRFNFAKAIGNKINIVGTGIEGGPGVTYVITAFLTTRRSYAVIGTELRFFPTNSTGNYKTITRNVISAKPFSVPLLPNGGLQNRFIAAVNLSTAEPSFNQRGYAAVNMFVSSRIPFRCRLTTSQ